MTNQTQILIVDDHSTNIKVLSDLLIAYGFAVLVAKDGESALQKLQRVSPDLILLDVLMPGIDGFETCQRLKSQENTQEIPVIFMTALTDVVDKIKGLTLGAVDYITKPFQHEEVIARINIHLQLRRLTKHLAEQNALLQDEMRSRTLAQTAQRRSEEKFAKLFRANPAGMAILSVETGRFLEINQSLTELTGYAPEEILGQTLDELGFLAQPADRDRLQQFLQATAPWDRVELPLQTRTGELRYFLTSAEIIDLAQGRCVLMTAQDITRSKQAEAALYDRESRLSAIFEQLAVGLCYSDLPGNLLQANQKFCNLLGYTTAEIGQLTVEQLTYPDDWALDQVHVQRLLAEEMASCSFEKRYLRKDGRPVWANLTLTSIRDITGAIVMLGGVVEDIEARKQLETARQQADAQLRQSEAKLRAAQRVAQVGDWEFDLVSQKITWSETAFLIFGFDPTQSEPTRAEFLQVFEADDRATLQDWIERSAHQGLSYQADCQIVGRDGTRRYIEGRGQAVRDDQDQVVKLFGTVLDITARKNVEAALRASEERFKLVLDANNDGIWDWDVSTNRTFRSLRWHEILGYAPDEITNRNEEWRDRIHPDDRRRVQALEQAYLTRQSPSYRTEYRLRGKDGNYRWIESRGIAQWDQQAQPLRMIGSCRDITAAKEQAVELQRARDAAEAANRAKSTFLANMNHELRTPLTVILGCSELLNLEGGLTPQQKQRLASIDRSVLHLLGLINDVLEISKVEAVGSELAITTVDLWALLHDLTEMFLPQAVVKHLQFKIERSPHLPQFIQTDERKLSQILINLLGNAVKFTATGSVRLLAEVSEVSWGANLTLCFVVEDTGEGIAASELDSIFAPFVQTDAGRKLHKGTGLGLAIGQQFARLLQGEITVQSKVGQGTRFSLRLPVQSALPPQLEVGLPPLAALPSCDHSSYRVLVVEDTDDMRDILVHMMVMVGFDVRAAVHGQAAIAQWQDWHPHLILMDMRMPVMDGYTATREIRAQEQTRRNLGQAKGAPGAEALSPTVIIAITANAFREDQQAILAAGCDDIVCKPFKEAELMATIAVQLGIAPPPASGTPRLMAADRPNPGPPTLSVRSTAAIPQLLAQMPSAWFLDLQRAALRLNADRCFQLIAQIPPDEVELAQVLINLLDNFRFDMIIDLISASQGIGAIHEPVRSDDLP